MSALSLDKLRVLVTGVDAAIARDVVRMVVAQGACVIAADKDAAKLARLDRDIGLHRRRLVRAAVDLANLGELKTWEEQLRSSGRMPQLMVCCCGSPTAYAGRSERRTPPKDVALGGQPARNCPAQLAQRVLQPAVLAHAEPLRRSVFDKALAVLRHPTLRGVLDRSPEAAAASYARSGPQEAPAARLRLVPSNPAPAFRADAA